MRRILAGNTRVRWSGRAARGSVFLFCENPYRPSITGPLDVLGVEVGANCEADQRQTVICALSSDQPGYEHTIRRPRITGFTMRTTSADGTTEVKPLPFERTGASFSGLLASGTVREFTCQIGLSVLTP
jgi:hypothetical protein